MKYSNGRAQCTNDGTGGGRGGAGQYKYRINNKC